MPTLEEAKQELSRRKSLSPEQRAALNELNRRKAQTNTNQALLGQRLTNPEPITTETSSEPQRGLLDLGTQAVAGFNEGLLANTFGAPVDVMNEGLRALGLPVSDKPFLGSEFIKQEALEPFDPGPPQGTGERVARRAGEVTGETTGALAVGLGVAQRTQKGVQAGRELSKNRVVEGFQKILLDLAKVDPALLTRAELALSAAAGLGGAVLREAFPESPNLADFVGQLTTNLGIQATIGFLRKAGTLARQKLVGLTEAEIQEQVGQNLSKAAGDDEQLLRRTEQAEQLREEFPDLNPTLGQASGQEGLITSERSLARTGARASQKFGEQTSEAQTAVRNKLEQDTPGTQQDVETLQSNLIAQKGQQEVDLELQERQSLIQLETSQRRVTARTNEIAQSMDLRLESAQRRLDTRLEAFPQGVTKEQLGQIQRQEYTKELDLFRAESSGLYSQVDQANTAIIPVETTVTRARTLREKLTGIERPQDIPSEIPLILKQFAGDDVPVAVETSPLLAPTGQPITKEIIEQQGGVTFASLRTLRQRLLSEIRDLSRSGTNDFKKNQLTEVLDAVETDLDQLASNTDISGKFPEAARAYREASRFYNQGVARLKQGTINRLRLREGQRFVTPDQKVPDLFLRGDVEMQDFVKALGDRESAADALRQAAQIDFFSVAVENGRVVGNRATAWMRNHEPALKQFPELRDEFQGLTKQQKIVDDLTMQAKANERDPEALGRRMGDPVFQELDEAQQLAQQVQRVVKAKRAEIDKAVTNLFIGDDANRAASNILSSGTPVAEAKAVMNSIKGDSAALRGFQRALWDEMFKRFEAQAIDALDRPRLQALAMDKFIKRNEAVMRTVFGNERTDRIAKSRDALQMIARTGRPPQAGSDTAVNIQSAMLDWGPFLSRLYAGPLGRRLVSWKWIWSERVARVMSQRFGTLENSRVEALLEEAFFDPKVGQSLILAARGANKRLVTKRLNAHLLNLGFRSLGGEEESESNDS